MWQLSSLHLSTSVEHMTMEAHDILCVPKDASEEQIRRAYKNLVRPFLTYYSHFDLIMTYCLWIVVGF